MLQKLHATTCNLQPFQNKAVDSGGIYGFNKVTVAELVAYMQLSSNLLSAKIIHF